MKTVFVNFNTGIDVASVARMLTEVGFKLLSHSIDPLDARCMRVDLGAREMELLRGRAVDTVDLVHLSELGELIQNTTPLDDELRDRIAIAAMTTLIGDPDTVAMNAYKMANAMLKAREATR